jgi:uncharacterized protein involved in cysteine biosynthesis
VSLLDKVFEGARSPLIGFHFLFAGPKLWKWAVVPAMLTFLSFTWGLVWGFSFLNDLVSAYMMSVEPALAQLPVVGSWFGSGSAGLTILTLVIKVTSLALGAVMWCYSCYVGARLILVPFNAIMAERTLLHLGVLKKEDLKIATLMKVFMHSLATGIVQVLFLLLLGILLFVLSFVPGFQPLVAFVGILIISFDCADYALECAGLSPKQKLLVFRDHLPEFFGFALVAGLTIMIPILNLLLLPALIIGAAKLVSSFKEIWT